MDKTDGVIIKLGPSRYGITGRADVDTERITEIIRLEAIWSNRSIIPEVWAERDETLRKQMVDIVKRYLAMERLPTPEEAHNSWMKSYFEMGWKYGEKRDPVLKTHPDLVPYNELPKDERDKDAIFLALVWAVKAIVKEIGGGCERWER